VSYTVVQLKYWQDWSWSPIINHCVLLDTVIHYWWSTPILSVFQLYHGIRHSDWLLVINSNLVSIPAIPWHKTQSLIIGDQLQSVGISVMPWNKTQWLIIGDQLQSCHIHCVLYHGIAEILTRLELITINQWLCLMPWYSWNTDKIGVDHQ
jgi:hypothetical protein